MNPIKTEAMTQNEPYLPDGADKCFLADEFTLGSSPITPLLAPCRFPGVERHSDWTWPFRPENLFHQYVK